MSKTLQLLSLLPRNPAEFCDRVAAGLETRRRNSKQAHVNYRVSTNDKALSQLSRILGNDLDEKLRELELAQLEAFVEQRQGKLIVGAPFSALHNGGSILARMCYAIARVTRPTVVVESGVCYGVTSAYLLQALQLNRHGHLHSIDLPPLGKHGDSYVGTLVPRDLRNCWSLHRGTTRRLLPRLLTSLAQIDLFLHDSLHTYENMCREFTAVWPRLSPGGVLISDDVEGNGAFQELSQRKDATFSVVLRESGKQALFGIAVKQS